MTELSLIQQYLLCALDEKGKLSGFSTERLVCFVGGGLLELQLDRSIVIEAKKVSATGELPKEKAYLKPLYDFLNQSKPIRLEKVLEAYNFSIMDKRFNELLEAVGASLTAAGLAEEKKAGPLGGRKRYEPQKEAVSRVIDQIRAELLEEQEVTEEMAVLTALLDRSNLLKLYFSKFEQRQLKEKLSEIRKSPMGKLLNQMVEYIEALIIACSI